MFTPKTCTLAPTATFSRRIAVWAPMPQPYADRLCIITVDQHGKLEFDWYFAEEWPAREHGTRRFQLIKQAIGDTSEVVVQIGIVKCCTCPAGQKSRTRECKHAAAMEAVMRPESSDAEPELYTEFSPAIGAEAGK